MANRLTRRRPRADAGLTLVELIVAFGLFSFLVAILVTAIVGFTSTTTEAQLDAETSSQVGAAMKRVERSVRYAESINYAGVTSGAAYVEWRTSAASAPTGVTTCTQLRYTSSDGKLAMRTWDAAALPSPGTWTVILSGLYGSATATYPFITIAAGAGSNYQGLTVSVQTGEDTDSGTTTASTVYAKNSSVDSPSNEATPGNQSKTPVCNGVGYRS